jgi:hypothetical protein
MSDVVAALILGVIVFGIAAVICVGRRGKT